MLDYFNRTNFNPLSAHRSRDRNIFVDILRQMLGMFLIPIIVFVVGFVAGGGTALVYEWSFHASMITGVVTGVIAVAIMGAAFLAVHTF